MSPILILTAVELEARRLAGALELPLLRPSPFPAFGRGRLRLAPVGLRAALCASRLPPLLAGLDRPLVVSAGLCGGLDPRLRPGDVVIPERVVTGSGERHELAGPRHRAAVAGAGPSVCTGSLITTREVVATPEAKAALFAASGAAAVDMESAVIVAQAAAAGLPALVIRAVSDGAAHPVALELTRLVTDEGRLRLGRALVLTARHPSSLPRALVLRQRAQHALGAVARALATLIG